MQPFLSTHREEIASLCRKHHVRRLSVFGSATREDFDPSRSDVDILVDFKDSALPAFLDHYGGVRAGLEALFAHRVDLLREGVIRNRYRLRSIDQDRVELYAA